MGASGFEPDNLSEAIREVCFPLPAKNEPGHTSGWFALPAASHLRRTEPEPAFLVGYGDR